MEAANSVKVQDMTQVAKSLSPEEQDVLMKYIYAGMAAPEHNNSGNLLAWHEKVNEGIHLMTGSDMFVIMVFLARYLNYDGMGSSKSNNGRFFFWLLIFFCLIL